MFLLNAYFARVFAPSLYGQIIFAQTVLLFVTTIFSDLGVRIVSVRNISLAKADTDQEVLNVSWSFLVLISVLSLAGMVAYSTALKGDEGRLTLIFALGVPLYALNLDWILKGRQRFKNVGLAEILKAAPYLLMSVLFIKSSKDMDLVGVGYLIGYAIATLLIFWGVYQLRAVPRFVFSPDKFKVLLRKLCSPRACRFHFTILHEQRILFLKRILNSRPNWILRSCVKNNLWYYNPRCIIR